MYLINWPFCKFTSGDQLRNVLPQRPDALLYTDTVIQQVHGKYETMAHADFFIFNSSLMYAFISIITIIIIIIIIIKFINVGGKGSQLTTNQRG